MALAGAPMEIRGYGPVKDDAVAVVKADVSRRLALLDQPIAAPERVAA